MKCSIGFYGLGVMGQSLALNMAGKGTPVAVYNIEPAQTKKFMEERAGKLPVCPAYDLKEFTGLLERPRKVFLMVTAGKAVDEVIKSLLTCLEPGDIVIDGGNTYYRDTAARQAMLREKGIFLIGAGISGGEEGALLGPSIMPSGDPRAYEEAGPLLEKMAAVTPEGFRCCHYIGPEGSGHYVKMVHNGIEYCDMQLICEIYYLMKRAAGLSNRETAEVFEEWNQGRLSSYLIQITARILKRRDEITGNDLVDMILDCAGKKGTGKWTAMEGLELGVPVPTIAEAEFVRDLSARLPARRVLAECFPPGPKKPVNRAAYIRELEKAMYAAKICSYAQGFALLSEASDIYGWDLDLGETALMWRAGCIIRAAFLEDIKKAYTDCPKLVNLMASPVFSSALKEAEAAWRNVVISCVENGCYIPALSSTLNYFDGWRAGRLPVNLLQAQRDYFGAHTYQRTDREASEHFHTCWTDTE